MNVFWTHSASGRLLLGLGINQKRRADEFAGMGLAVVSGDRPDL